jgi:hypothetical protein
MCGRYYLRSDKQRISKHFAANPGPGMSELVPDYNVTPATFQPVIRQSDDRSTRELLLMRWGLVPSSAVGRYSNAGRLPSGTICCTLTPDNARGLALKYRIASAAYKRVTSLYVLKSRTNFCLNFVRHLSASFRDFNAGKSCTQILETVEIKAAQFRHLSAARHLQMLCGQRVQHRHGDAELRIAPW